MDNVAAMSVPLAKTTGSGIPRTQGGNMNEELEVLTIRQLEHDPDNPRPDADHDTTSTSSPSDTTGAPLSPSVYTKTTATDSRLPDSPDGSTLPTSNRAALPIPTMPRRTDFGEFYPDGGWGWAVCGAVFIVHFLAKGMYLAAGTFMLKVIDEFKIDSSYAGDR